MFLIAHRGNLYGSRPNRENHPEYLLEAIEKGFQVELDVWVFPPKEGGGEETIFLGHDHPQYQVDLSFFTLHRKDLWCHCKNLKALEYLTRYNLNVFVHDNDDATLTSKGYVWTFPGKELVNNSIAVMPELWMNDEEDLGNCVGVCSDIIGNVMYGGGEGEDEFTEEGEA